VKTIRTAICFVILAALCFAIAGRGAVSSWTQAQLMQPQQLAREMQDAKSLPVIVFVGFPVLYRAAHIPNAILAGPCSKSEGLDLLSVKMRQTARAREVVIYCGCCPFVHCPNVKPAFEALQKMGFANVHVLELDNNFHTDWEAQGYPTERPGAVQPH
jgi:thiosulfate/3-mercaptopyruvate sulfurtransferase